MTHFRVRRTAAEVGARLLGYTWLVVSGRELAGDILSFSGCGGAELTWTGASTADQHLGPRTLHGWSGAWTKSARTRSLPRLGRRTVQTSLRSPLSRLGGPVPANSAPGPPSVGREVPPGRGGGKQQGDPDGTVRFSPPQPTRNSAGWPPGCGQRRVG